MIEDELLGIEQRPEDVLECLAMAPGLGGDGGEEFFALHVGGFAVESC